MSRFAFTLNGSPREVDADPMARALDVLREDLRLTGTKEGCGEGECGACTVLLDGEPVCACLVPAMQLGGADVRTVEGVASAGELDAVQRAMIEAGGVQCGACTPGVVVSLRALLDRDARPTKDAVREAIAGNLCRCTGYERIVRAALEAAERSAR